MEAPNHALKAEQLLATSLHFWWIAFLRSSKDYWWICQQKGQCKDKRLVKVWRDFGDIFQYKSFTQWWLHKGTALFDSPQIEMELSQAFKLGVQLLSSELKKPQPGMLCVAIPLHLDAARVGAAIVKLFETARVRGKHYDTDAKYQIIKGGNEKSYNSIKPAYLSHALRVCIDHSLPLEQINPWGNYQMSKFLELCPQHHPQAGDSIIRTKNKQRAMRTKNSQAASMAAKLIANVEIGRFPSSKDVRSSPRWTKDQQVQMDSAIAGGQWQRANWFEQEHAFMLAAHCVDQVLIEGRAEQRCLSLLTDMRLSDNSCVVKNLKTKRLAA